jgi:type III pantothenate kinase
MITLCIDIGNTKTKAAVFNDAILLELFTDSIDIHHILATYPITHSILSSVGNEQQELELLLAKSTSFVKLSPGTPLPFHNAYATPNTLGMDRVAAIAGAMHFFPGTACLVIDMGTCITFDFITADAQYLGGAISPGASMRLKAMHQFTQKLPDLSFKSADTFIGNSTETSMLSGTFYGILGEIEETIHRYEEQFGFIQVITCGGDSPVFDKHIKRNIFAAPFLVLYGLNKILTFHVR